MKAYNNAVARLLQPYSRLQTRSDMNTTTEDTMGSSVGRLSEIPLVFSNRIDHAFHRGEPPEPRTRTRTRAIPSRPEESLGIVRRRVPTTMSSFGAIPAEKAPLLYVWPTVVFSARL